MATEFNSFHVKILRSNRPPFRSGHSNVRPAQVINLITRLNLSSKPFRNRKLPYAFAAVIVVLAFAGLLFGYARYRSVKAENETGRQTIIELERQISELRAKGERVRKNLSPVEKELMIAGHKLVATKQFGWSRLLYELERVMPRDVSASRINVNDVFKDGDRVVADLEFAVVSRNYTSVLAMIERMNESGVFRASLRGQDLQETDRVKYSEYTLLLIYRPSAGLSLNPPGGVAVGATRGGADD